MWIKDDNAWRCRGILLSRFIEQQAVTGDPYAHVAYILTNVTPFKQGQVKIVRCSYPRFLRVLPRLIHNIGQNVNCRCRLNNRILFWSPAEDTSTP